jgi:sugar/nucleoside kinase (ribokinase family)
MSLLAIGSVAFDSVSTPFGAVERVVGGSATYFGLTASFFTDVAIVAVVGEDFTERHLQIFLNHGIDIRQIQRRPGKSFFWSGTYDRNLNEVKTLATELNVFADFRPEVHPDYRNAPYLFLGNIDPELQGHVLDQMAVRPLVALDSMNYWIQNQPEALARVLARVDIFLVNEGEARMLTGEYHLVPAVRRIEALGPRTVVVKRGEYGCLVSHAGELFLAPAFPMERVLDPTGAGDCFAGGFMGYLANTGRRDFAAVRDAALYGSVMASFDIEDFSVNRLCSLTLPEIQARLERFRQVISV